MLVTLKRRIIVVKWKSLICRCASALLVILGFAVFSMASDAYAGGVRFGFGVDVASPVYAAAPPEVYPPEVVVQRAPPPPPVVVERTTPPPAVVVERIPAVVVYEGPVVVERRSRVYYYYRPSYQYHSYHVETEREYRSHRSYNWEDDGEY